MTTDSNLIQIVDAAVADAARRAGSWLLCRLGCTDCCMGPFPISPLDAQRLRNGLAQLAATDPARARQITARAQAAAERLRTLSEEATENDPCPVLDPASGACDLYPFRPLVCRTFGPPLRMPEGGFAVCELCFNGAAPETVAACAVSADADTLEAPLLRALATQGVTLRETTIAEAICP
ncbi:MAG: YkgJ family cysteine cluster protein [Bryobacteraceae bacterium]